MIDFHEQYLDWLRVKHHDKFYVTENSTLGSEYAWSLHAKSPPYNKFVSHDRRFTLTARRYMSVDE